MDKLVIIMSICGAIYSSTLFIKERINTYGQRTYTHTKHDDFADIKTIKRLDSLETINKDSI